MNTIAFIIGGILLALVIFSKIPGLEHLVRPVIDILFSLLKVLAENAYSWTIWLWKALFAAHIEVARNLFMKPEDLDPSQAAREKEK